MKKERLSNLMLSACLLSVAICLIMDYSTISAEVLRICLVTSSYLFFLESVRKLIIRMRKQHAETLGIKKIVTKMIRRHSQPFKKFGLSVEKIALNISSAK